MLLIKKTGSGERLKSSFGRITIVAHLLIPKVIRLLLAQSDTVFKSLDNFLFDGAHNTISSAKRPPQYLLPSILTPNLLHFLNTSLIKRLNKIGERGQPCLTPRWILNESENFILRRTLAFEVKYRFSMNL